MKNHLKKLLALLLSVLMAVSVSAVPLASSAADLASDGSYIDGEVIVVLNKKTGNYLKAANASSLYGKNISLKSGFSFKGKDGSSKVNVAVLKSNKYSTKQLIRKLKKNSAVKYAFPNSKKKALDITDDAYSKYQWALENNGQNSGTADFDVNAEGLWDKAASSKKEQIVAIVDTGLDLTHPEFKDIVWENKHGSKLLGKHGFDFSGDNADKSPQDNNGHGTHCAGIIAAAADNQSGISGINKSNTKIMPIKWLDADGSGYTDAVLEAYDYISRAVDLGENVVAISNSWGGMGNIDELNTYKEIYQMFGEKGVINVVAAGNEATDITEASKDSGFFFFEEPFYTVPAATNSPYQITVAATNENDELTTFSNYSSTRVHVAAPGADVLSSVSYNCFNPTVYSDEKKAAIVATYQNFDNAYAAGDFGYPSAVALSGETAEKYIGFDVSTNFTVAQSDMHFGVDGKSAMIKYLDPVEEPDDEDSFTGVAYCFEMPYTIPEEDKNYSISMMLSATAYSEGIIADVPADYDVEKGVENLLSKYALGYFVVDTTYWNHFYFDIDTSAKSTYKKGTSRKLVFLAISTKEGSEMYMDDLAISKQGVDPAEFEKYDFYNGTSMATPYVAGAVALIRNAYPESSALDAINMIVNTGRTVDGLKDKVKSGKVLSLDNLDKTPPMISKLSYNDKGSVSITGSFKDVTSVKVNGTEVTPTSNKQNEIVIPDNKYSTKKIKVEVTNAYGKDEYSSLIANKTLIEKSAEVIGEPGMVSGGFMLPAGDKAYYLNAYNNIGAIAYDNDMQSYMYDEAMMPQIDMSVLFENANTETFSAYPSAAVYSNGKIYFVMVSEVTATAGTVIGYENAFGYIDVTTGATKLLCETPDDALLGSSLAAYNGDIYLAGGYDNGEFSNAVYKYNASQKKFVKQSATLPEGRAYATFLQYENKLYGVYGAVKGGKLPSIISFDGKTWNASKLNLNSDDFTDYSTDDKNPLKVYKGNVGYGNKGLFLNGVYVYGYGDTYVYNVATDKLTASTYASKNELAGTKIIGTTLPGCFVGYEQTEGDTNIDDIGVGSYGTINKMIICGDTEENPTDTTGENGDIFGEFESEPVAYKLNIKNAYAKLDTSAVKNAKVTVSIPNAVYGDTVTVKLTPNNGYYVNSISVDGKTVVKDKAKASVKLSTASIKLGAKITYVAPAAVTNVKASLNKSKKGVVTWKKAKKANGYQVQLYTKGKWKTVKTIDKAKTVKFTTAKKLKKGTYKYRVRAYRTYKGKKYYGKWSKVAKLKVKAKTKK